MSDRIIETFAALGILFILGSLAIFTVILISIIKDRIQDARYRYKLKHRFDKPPVAKCFCRDCVFRDGNNCEIIGKFVLKDNFCWAASPLRKDHNDG